MQGRNALRLVLYVVCLTLAVAALFSTMLESCQPVQKAAFTSVHPAGTMPPLWGFAQDSLVNTADAKALDKLPGVGEVIAQRIIDMRESLNGFRLPEDLMLVKGIGEKTFTKIMDALEEPLVQLQE